MVLLYRHVRGVPPKDGVPPVAQLAIEYKHLDDLVAAVKLPMVCCTGMAGSPSAWSRGSIRAMFHGSQPMVSTRYSSQSSRIRFSMVS